jgi:multidrug efflux pump subunit AcrA (membrane-fusion protein)
MDIRQEQGRRTGAPMIAACNVLRERFEFRAVTTRRTIGDAIEITSGLQDGERVVLRGADTMPRP